MTRITGWKCDGCNTFHEGDSDPKVSVGSFNLDYHLPRALRLEEEQNEDDRPSYLDFCDWPCARNGLVSLWPPLVGRFIEARMAEEAAPPPEPAVTPELLSEATEPVQPTAGVTGELLAEGSDPVNGNPQEIDGTAAPAKSWPEEA